MDEHFREIKNFPGYRVSRDGEVQSRWGRGCRHKQGDAWRFLKPIPRRRGYLTVNLARDGGKTARYIHHLVLEAFAGPRPPGLIGCHNDGDPTNNRLGNLRWDTYEANEADKLRHGTRAWGSGARSKLHEGQVAEIRQQWRDGVAIRDLAAHYGVSHQAIRAIISGKTWRHLPLDEPQIDAAHDGQQGSGGSSGTAHSAQTRTPHSSQAPTQQPHARAPQSQQV